MENVASEAFEKREEVLVAYLYGSMVKGTEHEGSDVDVALLLRKDFEPGPLYTSRISSEIEKKMDSEREVEIRILNERSIIFQHQVLKHGKRIFVRDENSRIKFETYVYDRYLDYRPFFKRFNEIRKKRVLA